MEQRVDGSGLISIPAPARGATRLWEKEVSPRKFQFPPLREGRRG